MTREEILAMDPGRRLDWEIRYTLFGIGSDAFDGDGELWTKDFQLVPKYSTDISAAMEAEGKVIEQNHQKMCEYVRQLMSVMSLDETDRHLSTFAKLLRSTPEQRCKASLLAVME